MHASSTQASTMDLGSGMPYKKRIKMACDVCHEQRIKCDGRVPCNHCFKEGYNCLYARPVKRRGAKATEVRAHYPERSPRRRDSGSREEQRSLSVVESMTKNLSATFSASNGNFSSPICLESRYVNEETIRPNEHLTEVNPSRDATPISPSHISAKESKTPRYPILEPILQTIPNIGASIACEMLETYFNNSPWVKTYLMRKESILTVDVTTVRHTKPSLLYAMLCIATHNHEDPLFGVSPRSRQNLTEQLFILAESSLTPMNENRTILELDDIITYIQLATVLSASEFKAKSVRWWSIAYHLAKELRLHEEVSFDASEELKEERRRTWWLLYCADRQQALAVRQELSFRDVECATLIRPCKERFWQSTDELVPSLEPERGILYRVSDSGLFGWFLPLMSILGEIVLLHNLQEADTLLDLQVLKTQIEHHMDIYTKSLRDCRTEMKQSSTCEPYARHILHTLHILIYGKWDPIDLLNHSRDWVLSQDFISCAGHAIDAANAVNEVLCVDPDLRYMPLFFGIFLLQGTFPLLLVLDSFGAKANPETIQACEIIIHAHSVSILTINRDYQRKFRKALRTMVDGYKVSMDIYPEAEEYTNNILQTKLKVREVLGSYRWSKTRQGLITDFLSVS